MRALAIYSVSGFRQAINDRFWRIVGMTEWPNLKAPVTGLGQVSASSMASISAKMS